MAESGLSEAKENGSRVGIHKLNMDTTSALTMIAKEFQDIIGTTENTQQKILKCKEHLEVEMRRLSSKEISNLKVRTRTGLFPI